jgi:hypothetical protein
MLIPAEVISAPPIRIRREIRNSIFPTGPTAAVAMPIPNIVNPRATKKNFKEFIFISFLAYFKPKFVILL